MKAIHTMLVLALVAVLSTLTACSHALRMIHGTDARRPAASEFGLGPRTSAAGSYVATLEPATPLRPRQMLTLRVVVRDAAGRAIDAAGRAIDAAAIAMRASSRTTIATNTRRCSARCRT